MADEILRDANYKISACCVLCKFGVFGNNSMMGRCNTLSTEINSYSSRAVPVEVVRYGVCDLYEVSVSEPLSRAMGDFMEFCE